MPKKCDVSNTEVAEICKNNIKTDLGKFDEEEEKVYSKEETIKAIETFFETNDKVKYISRESASKIRFSNKMIKDDKKEIGFYSVVKEAFKNTNRKNLLKLNATIDDYSVKDSFIGFMYSDGDGLGDFLKHTKDKYEEKDNNNRESEIEYLRFLRKFSIILDYNTKKALLEVLIELKEKEKFKSLKKDEKKLIVGEFLIVGGDDVCAVFPADLVLEISNKFQKKFEEKMKAFEEFENKNEKEKNKGDNITSSSGVIIAKSKTPMFQLFDQALGRQKNAKLKRYNDNKYRDKKSVKTGYIDFQVIGSEGNVDIKKYRKKFEGEGKEQVTERPYAVNSENSFKYTDEKGKSVETKDIQILIDKIKRLQKEEFPKTKIRYIFDTKINDEKTSDEKIMEMTNILSKMSKENLELLNEEWKIEEKLKISSQNNENKFNVFEDIYDVLEMYDFI
ncbi:MAG: hypothetical protein HXM47_05260, partial [Pseudoleptotrichia goodfellowii]|nr:hypothetical protein [Pseudoleptotrichia goodfellowii]